MAKGSLFSKIKSDLINNDYLDEVNDLTRGILQRAHDVRDEEFKPAGVEFIKAQRRMQDKPIKMRRGSRGTRGVLKDGEFKNLFETGTSSGSENKSYRRSTENKGLGIDPDAPAEKRPKYGYVSGDVDGYGDNIFTFKPEVKNRATFTLGDSLDDSLVSSRYNFSDWTAALDPSQLIAENSDDLIASLKDIKNTGLRNNNDIYSPYDARFWTRNLSNATEGMNTGLPVGKSYIETQIQGPLTLGDVEKLRLVSNNQRDIDQARKAAQQFGFRLEVPNDNWDGFTSVTDLDEYWKCIENCIDK